MGSSISQVSQSTQPQSKSGSMPQFAPPTPGQQSGSGKGSSSRGVEVLQNAAQGPIAQQSPNMPYTQDQQPQFGQPNKYPNTVGQWDNTSNQLQQSPTGGGKGKG